MQKQAQPNIYMNYKSKGLARVYNWSKNKLKSVKIELTVHEDLIYDKDRIQINRGGNRVFDKWCSINGFTI